MIEFLLKSSLCMAVLLAAYYLLLEKEKMHRFNRFYLLSALVFSLAVPFITVITYFEQVTISTEATVIASTTLVNNITPEQTVDHLLYAAWALYALIVFILAVRFIKNIFTFIRKAYTNPTIQFRKAKLVLLDEKVLPHTFLNYIFVNREDYETRMIEKELYTHEYTHVIEKHSLDILFIEVLKTIFWFNPLLYIYKKAIQLNHEFLADQKVIATTNNTIYYQKLLLEKASIGTTYPMASNFNFSLTKKRFIMMTKTTSTVKAGILKAAIIPVLATLMMLLCTKTVAQETNKAEQSVVATNEQMDEAIKQHRLKAMEVMSTQIDSMKRANPDAFSDDPAIRYKKTTFRFIDKKGIVTEKKGYKSLNRKEKTKVANIASNVISADTLEFTETPKATDPEFPGGLEAFYKAINANFNIPEVDNNITAKIYVSFVIEEDGTMSDIEVVRDPGYGLGQEAVRVIKLIKEKWKPGTRDGKPVKTSYTLPITINIKK